MKAVITTLSALALLGCASGLNFFKSKDAPPSQQAQAAAPAPAPAAPREVPKNNIPVIVIEGSERSTIAFTAQNEEPVRTASVDEIESIAKQYAEAKKPLVVAIDASRLRERKYLTSPATKPVKKQTGVARKPNPALVQAEEAVREAKARLHSAESSDQEVQRQAAELGKTPNVNPWGLVAGASALAYAGKSNLASAQNDLEEANTRLRETEPTIEVPVYSTVMARVASLVVEKTGEIIAFVIDGPSQSARTVRIPVQHETRSEYVFDPTLGDNAAVPTGTSTPASHEVSIDQILKESTKSPHLALADAVSAIKTDRETFSEAMAALDKQRSETTSRTLAQLTGTGQPDGKEKPQQIATAEPKASDSSESVGASATGSAGASGGGIAAGSGAGASGGGSAAGRVAGARAAGSATASGGAGGGACPKDTSSLAEKVGPTGLPKIDELLERVAGIDIVAAMREATSQGYSPSSAVQASLDTAKAMKKTAAEAARAAGQAFGGPGYSDEEFLSNLDEGTLAPEDCESPARVPVCAAIAMRTEAIANDMVATAMSCHAKRGTWPK
jgi:hypothetical protein